MKFVFTLLFFGAVTLGISQQHVIVLGVAQDGGFPHIGCFRACRLAHSDPTLSKYVVSLALVDSVNKKWWLFEATPDMDRQLQYFQDLTNQQYPYLPEGIFLTHAHIGHYTGLMFLGREALGAKGIKVYALPKMIAFLQNNGPWNQLVTLNNISLKTLSINNEVRLLNRMKVTPYLVPHRDEFSETAGYKIQTDSNSYLFIPDIDKWDQWDMNIISEVKAVDHAFLDATFLRDGEIPNRPMNEIPHPFVEETMKLFEGEAATTKQKIVFIHLNHTNPLLFDEQEKSLVQQKGYRIAKQGSTY